MADTYRPNAGMQAAAKRAVAWIAEGKAGDGFTPVGRKRASDLAAGRSMSADVVLRMYSFFARHEVDKKATGFTSGEDGFPTPGRVSWDAWGGDAGFSWSTKIRNQIQNALRQMQSASLEENDMAMMMDDGMMSDEGTMLHDDLLNSLANFVQYQISCYEETEMVPGEMPVEPMMQEGMYSKKINKIRAGGITAGTFVSWNSAGGTAQGKVESVITSGQAQSSDGYTMDGSTERPVFKIRLFKDSADGFVPTDTTVLHAEDALTKIAALRVLDSALIQARKSAMATAERITMQAEVRAITTDDGSLRIGGYAATFNQEATGLNFREVIAPGAFKRTLETADPVFLLINHDMDQLPLASTGSGTLSLREDATGLRMDAELDASNPRAQELSSALRRGDVNKMSFAFTIAPGGDTRSDGLRTLTDLDLYEVSIVTLPAYDSTSVGMRSQENDLALQKKRIEIAQKQIRLRK